MPFIRFSSLLSFGLSFQTHTLIVRETFELWSKKKQKKFNTFNCDFDSVFVDVENSTVASIVLLYAKSNQTKVYLYDSVYLFRNLGIY